MVSYLIFLSIQLSSPGRASAKVRARPASAADMRKSPLLSTVVAAITHNNPDIVVIRTPEQHITVSCCYNCWHCCGTTILKFKSNFQSELIRLPAKHIYPRQWNFCPPPLFFSNFHKQFIISRLYSWGLTNRLNQVWSQPNWMTWWPA